jgi:class 3 adenylate cyclase
VQGLLTKLGLPRFYVMVNALLYSLVGPFDHESHTFMGLPAVQVWRHQLFDALVTSAPQPHAPRSHTPSHLAEKILTSKAALEGERKQVTVLFADLKGSMELLADRDPEEARQLLDPVLERMMAAVHRYEGTVNQVMGDGIMALFGAPLAHEDHAVRACYAALHMQEAIGQYAEGLRRQQGLDVQIRVGLNSGAVVVRALGNDLHMDYTAVGQTTHLAARMEQLARPGTALLTADTWRLVEGYIEVTPWGPVPVKGLPEPVEVYELLRAGPVRSRLQAAVAQGLTRFVGRAAELEQLRQGWLQLASNRVASATSRPLTSALACVMPTECCERMTASSRICKRRRGSPRP